MMAKMHLAIPTVLLDPIIHIFDQEEYSTRKVIRDGTLLQLLRYIPVNVSISTVETLFPMQALSSLQIGDTLVMDQRQDAPVVVKVAGRSKLYAKARLDSAQKTFIISGLMRPKREEPINGHNAQ
jgi:flagellar motor switch protein FliM